MSPAARVCERRVELRTTSPVRLPGAGRDGVARRSGEQLERLLHPAGEPVVVRAAQPAPDRLVLVARGPSRDACDRGIERMRFALRVDDDLTDFHRRNVRDPLIGRLVRATPWLRPPRRPEPFEALAWAVCEQLIEYTRAAAIQRRIVARLGRRCSATGLADLPAPATLAATAPALLESFDLARGRARALVAVAREVASGRIDLDDPVHERGWLRLRTIPGIGAWTVEVLALHGQGRLDQVPAGDLGLRRLVGRLSTGDPRSRVETEQVREFFEPYAPYAGLAATYALAAVAAPPTPHSPRRSPPATRPAPEETRRSPRGPCRPGG